MAKAYDGIEWVFLGALMLKFGFCDRGQGSLIEIYGTSITLLCDESVFKLPEAYL